jgi:hypothetical protein
MAVGLNELAIGVLAFDMVEPWIDRLTESSQQMQEQPKGLKLHLCAKMEGSCGSGCRGRCARISGKCGR